MLLEIFWSRNGSKFGQFLTWSRSWTRWPQCHLNVKVFCDNILPTSLPPYNVTLQRIWTKSERVDVDPYFNTAWFSDGCSLKVHLTPNFFSLNKISVFFWSISVKKFFESVKSSIFCAPPKSNSEWLTTAYRRSGSSKVVTTHWPTKNGHPTTKGM